MLERLVLWNGGNTTKGVHYTTTRIHTVRTASLLCNACELSLLSNKSKFHSLCVGSCQIKSCQLAVPFHVGLCLPSISCSVVHADAGTRGQTKLCMILGVKFGLDVRMSFTQILLSLNHFSWCGPPFSYIAQFNVLVYKYIQAWKSLFVVVGSLGTNYICSYVAFCITKLLYFFYNVNI